MHKQLSIQSNTYLLARLPIGMSMLGHGLVRMPKLATFAEGMASSFEETILPNTLVQSFGYLLPFVELGIGLCVVIGLFTRPALITGVLLMCVLIFGSSFNEQWQSIAIQMFYGAYFSLLYLYAEQYNDYSLDRRIRG